MFWPRLLAWSLLTLIVATSYSPLPHDLLGLHEPEKTSKLIMLMGIWVVLTICKAHDATLEALRSEKGGTTHE